MKRPIGFVLAGFLACLPLAAQASGTLEVPGYEGGDGPSVEEYQKAKESLYAGLALDFDKVSEKTTLFYRPTKEDLELLEDKRCKTCKSGGESSLYRVGVNGALSHSVSFAGVAAPGLKPVDVSGGVLRALPTGELVWTIGIESPGARGMRVGFEGFALAEGVTATLYNWNDEAYGPYTSAGPNQNGFFWSHTVGGDVAFIELRAPDLTSLQASALTITGIGHFDATLFPDSTKKCDYTEPCQLDATCFGTADFAPIASVRRAVGQMVFSDGGGQFVCTGSLIADVDQTETPYFLTANHCLSTQRVAQTLQVTWRYQTSACDAACPSRDEARFPKTLGATLLATGATPASTDFTLLRLTGSVPGDAFYLGWTRQNVQTATGLTLYRLSHPAGAPLQYTRYKVTPDQFCDSFAPNARFVYTVPDLGAAEGGASGSSILNASGQVVGQLLGACGPGLDNICQNATQFRTVDGAFRVTYERIKEWIDPPDPIEIPFSSQYYLAEGVTGPGFDTYVLLSNSSETTPIKVEMTLLAEREENQILTFDIPASRRLTVLVDSYIKNDGVAISLRETSGRAFVAERAIYAIGPDGAWTGGHTSVGATAASRTWYFPEGASVQTAGPGSNFETYLLVANPNNESLPLTFQFFLPDGTSFTKNFVAPARRRMTVLANGDLDPRLANASFFTQISSTSLSFYAERAMWWRNPSVNKGSGFVEGNNSLGLTELSRTWYFAEGNTLPGVDQFILLANPGSAPANVTIEYLRQGTSSQTRTLVVPANSRQTVNVRFDQLAGLGTLTTTERHGTAITSDVPIAAERSMYFSTDTATWIAGHNTVGAPRTANVWALPEGASFTDQLRTDVLIANPNTATVALTVVYLLESGESVRREYNLAGKQRLTLHGTDEQPLIGRAYSTIVLSANGNVVAERSSTFKALGAEIGGATNSMGISLIADLSTKEAQDKVVDSLRSLGALDTLPTPTVTPTVTPTPRVP